MRLRLLAIAGLLMAGCGDADPANSETVVAPVVLSDATGAFAALSFWQGHWRWLERSADVGQPVTKRSALFLDDLNLPPNQGTVAFFQAGTGVSVSFNTSLSSFGGYAEAPTSVEFEPSYDISINFNPAMTTPGCNVLRLCDVVASACQYATCKPGFVQQCYAELPSARIPSEVVPVLCAFADYYDCLTSGAGSACAITFGFDQETDIF